MVILRPPLSKGGYCTQPGLVLVPGSWLLMKPLEVEIKTTLLGGGCADLNDKHCQLFLQLRAGKNPVLVCIALAGSEPFEF